MGDQVEDLKKRYLRTLLRFKSLKFSLMAWGGKNPPAVVRRGVRVQSWVGKIP